MARDAVAMSALLAERVTEPAPPPRVRIRPLDGGDTAGLGQLMFETFAGTVDDEGGPLEDHVEVARRTMAGQFGAVRGDASLVATAGTGAPGLVGAVVITARSGLPVVAFALVRPDWQHRGLGMALLSRSANILVEAGEPRWVLSVTRHNPAVRLYRRLGFAETAAPLRRGTGGPAATSAGSGR